MISDKVLKLLNEQIRIEGESAQIYLSMHCYAADYGLEGTAKWLLEQYHEEVKHMLKLVAYIDDQGERAVISQLDNPTQEFGDVHKLFQAVYDHEMFVSGKIDDIVLAAIADKDRQTATFMDWYVLEQIEEQGVQERIKDKLKWVKDDTSIILFDQFIGCMR
jgi:ferritin